MGKENIKYTTDGKKVVVIGDLNQSEKIVQEIFVTEDGCEIPSGERFVVKSLLDSPSVPWKEKSLKELEQKYESQKKYWDAQINQLNDEKRIVSNQLRQIVKNIKSAINNDSLIKAIDGIELFLCADKMYVLANDYRKFIIKEFNADSDDFFASRYDNSYGRKEFDSLRLVSLYGRSDGDLCWQIGEYADYSGSFKEFLFFKSEKECVEKMQEIVDSTIQYGARELIAEKEFGIKLDDLKVKTYLDSLSKSKEDRLNTLKRDCELLEQEILEIKKRK